jgi:hypothetical protein
MWMSVKMIFPWFVRAEPGYHDFHHTHNVGNFGRCQFWDWAMGTDVAYYRYMEKQK